MKITCTAKSKRKENCIDATRFILRCRRQLCCSPKEITINVGGWGECCLRSSPANEDRAALFNVITVSHNREAIVKKPMKHEDVNELGFTSEMLIAPCAKLKSSCVGHCIYNSILLDTIVGVNRLSAIQSHGKTSAGTEIPTPVYRQIPIWRHALSGRSGLRGQAKCSGRNLKKVTSDISSRQRSACCSCIVYCKSAGCMQWATVVAGNLGTPVRCCQGKDKASATGTELKKPAPKKRHCGRKRPLLDTRNGSGMTPDRFVHGADTSMSSARAANRQHLPPEADYQMVPLSMIEENPYRGRLTYDLRIIEELVGSILACGQLKPGIAIQNGQRYILIEGHYRKAALEIADISQMKLVIWRNLGYQDLYSAWFKENVERHRPSATDNAFAWNSLLATGVFPTRADLAKAIGVAESTVSKTLSLSKCSPELFAFACCHPTLNFSVLYELFLLESEAGSTVALEIAHDYIEDRATREDIIRARKKFALKAWRRLRGRRR